MNIILIQFTLWVWVTQYSKLKYFSLVDINSLHVHCTVYIYSIDSTKEQLS